MVKEIWLGTVAIVSSFGMTGSVECMNQKNDLFQPNVSDNLNQIPFDQDPTPKQKQKKISFDLQKQSFQGKCIFAMCASDNSFNRASTVLDIVLGALQTLARVQRISVDGMGKFRKEMSDYVKQNPWITIYEALSGFELVHPEKVELINFVRTETMHYPFHELKSIYFLDPQINENCRVDRVLNRKTFRAITQGECARLSGSIIRQRRRQDDSAADAVAQYKKIFGLGATLDDFERQVKPLFKSYKD